LILFFENMKYAVT